MRSSTRAGHEIVVAGFGNPQKTRPRGAHPRPHPLRDSLANLAAYEPELRWIRNDHPKPRSASRGSGPGERTPGPAPYPGSRFDTKRIGAWMTPTRHDQRELRPRVVRR